MSNINFKRTAKGYSAEFQRRDGFGYETRYYRREDVREAILGHDPEAIFEDDITYAEFAILGGHVLPFRVTR